MLKPQLVLDIGGVLAANLTPVYWNRLSETAGCSSERLYAAYKEKLSARLWTGAVTEEEFWSWLCEELPSIKHEVAKSQLLACLTPLPAMDKLAEWSQLANIHVLSNHRSEWVNPLLEPVLPYLTSVTISSDVGFSKPSSDIFKAVQRMLPDASRVLFVDDSTRNLAAAEQHGWSTLLADEAGNWIAQVPPLLAHACLNEEIK